MRYIIMIILIILLVLVSLYVFERQIKQDYIEKFVSAYDEYKKESTLEEINRYERAKVLERGLDKKYDKITDPIEDAYLPQVEKMTESPTDEITKNMNEYTIISTYKNTLNRQPTETELKKLLNEFHNQKLEENVLKTRIYNSPEYKMIVKMQSNDVEPELISTVSSINMIDNLKKIYKEELKTDIKSKMISPLKDCYIHLQYNDYLFRAMLRDVKYSNFEKEVLETTLLSREKLLDIFNKYFLLSELRIEANKIKRDELLSMKSMNVVKSVEKKEGADINSPSTLGAEQEISKIVKDGNNVFNINIVLNDERLDRTTPYSNDNNNDKNDKSGVCKIYDPINYKQHYRGDTRYRPNVCSYGTAQVVQPLYLGTYGTDLKEAAENTAVGSIMPKFEYREYEEIKK